MLAIVPKRGAKGARVVRSHVRRVTAGSALLDRDGGETAVAAPSPGRAFAEEDEGGDDGEHGGDGEGRPLDDGGDTAPT